MNDKGQHGNDFRTLKTKLTLRPGQAGTKQLLAQYGDRLLCVRYRYDPRRNKRVKTVEIIIDESDWTPTPGKRAWNAIVGIQIAPKERSLQRRVKAAGAKWNLTRKLWELPYRTVLELDLADRIFSEDDGHGV